MYIHVSQAADLSEQCPISTKSLPQIVQNHAYHLKLKASFEHWNGSKKGVFEPTVVCHFLGLDKFDGEIP